MGSQPDPTKCTLTLNNRHGKYSPRNPYSPYYGVLGRNTPLRVTIPEADAGSALVLSSWNGTTRRGAAATAAYHSSMVLTGDMEWRFAGRHHDAGWRGVANRALASRYQQAGNSRGWQLALSAEGYPYLAWTTDGTVATLTSSTSHRSNAPLPPLAGDRAIRVYLDVDNGAGGHTVRFWTGPTINGPWTQLGTDVINPGAANVFNGTAPIRVGYEPDLSPYGFDGQVLGFELRSGLAGTKIVSPDFTTATPGATSFMDPQGHTFALDSPDRAYITDRGARFLGEVSTWPVEWDLSGNDVWTSLEASDITRRMQQGDSAATSPLRRTLLKYNPISYLPLEEGSQADRATNAVPGVPTAQTLGVSFGADDSLPGATTSAVLSTGASLVLPINAPASATVWSLLFLFREGQAFGGGETVAARIWTTGGTIARWDFLVSSSSYRWTGYDIYGTQVTSTPTTGFGLDGDPSKNWVAMQLTWRKVGGNIEFQSLWHGVGSQSWWVSTTSPTPVVGAFAGPARIEFTGTGPMDGASLAHVFVLNAESPMYVAEFRQSSNGFSGETAGERMYRLCAEAGVPLAFAGTAAFTEIVGRQRTAPLLDLLRDAADADGGILLGDRGRLGLIYRPRTSLYNQGAHPLSYTGGHISAPFKPVDDDSLVANDVTVSRIGGGSAQAVETSGPLSIQPPPNGVGVYDRSFELNLGLDGRLTDHANWHKMLGTRDEARYPSISVDLSAPGYTSNPDHLARTAQLGPGEMLWLTDLPPWVPPGPTKALIQGYTETIDGFDWDIAYNASPGAVWDIAAINSDQRIAPADAYLASPVGAADTTLLLSSDQPWTRDPADFPLDIRLGGEKVVASAIAHGREDGFVRTTSNGWGGFWQTISGPASAFSVGGAFASIQVPALLTECSQIVAGFSTLDVEMHFDAVLMSTPQTGTGYIRIVNYLRWQDPSNWVALYLLINPAGAIDMQFKSLVGGVNTTISALTSPTTWSPGVSLKVHTAADGSSLRARVWRDGTRDPYSWQIYATDPAPASGTVGFGTLLAPGMTNAMPYTVVCDSLWLLRPQLVTLSARAANGISRAWGSGTEMDVWNPGIIPL